MTSGERFVPDARSRSAATAIAAAFVLGGLWGCGGDAPTLRDAPSATPRGGEIVSDGKPGVALFFPGPAEKLWREERPLPTLADEAKPDDGEVDERERISQVVAAVLEGPTTPGLSPVLESSVRSFTVVLAADGTVFLDLQSVDEKPPSSTGSRTELLTVWSLVTSITHNSPAAHRVVLLWNSRQLETLSGHVDTSRPLGPLPDLVAATAPGSASPEKLATASERQEPLIEFKETEDD